MPPNPAIRWRTSVLQEFDDCLPSWRRRSKIDGRDFFLTSRVLDWFRDKPPNFNNPNYVRILNAVYGTEDPKPNWMEHLLKHTKSDDIYCWLRVMTILLQIKHDDTTMGRFILQLYQQDVYDTKLPLTLAALKDLFKPLGFDGNEVIKLSEAFWRLQFAVLADSTLNEARSKTYRPGEHILPITTLAPLKEGGQGKIFEIQVPSECIPPSLAERLMGNQYTEEDECKYAHFALKILHHHRSYHDERLAYQALQSVQGVIRCLGDWKLETPGGKDEYHLLLEWGTVDLGEFFQVYASPSTFGGVLHFWKKMSIILYAVSKIHLLESSENYERRPVYYGWHSDIKPKNILYCKGELGRVFKLADPGFATFVEKDKAAINGNGLPEVAVRGGTTTYGGPERPAGAGRDTPISQRFDIWSLGCVFSTAVTWVILGRRGVDLFRNIRMSLQPHSSGNTDDGKGEASIELSADYHPIDNDLSAGSGYQQECQHGSDCFHNGKNVSQSVRDWHLYLRQALKVNDTITGRILDLVERHMLQADSLQRMSAGSLHDEFNMLLKDASAGERMTRYKVPRYFQESIDREQYKEAVTIIKRLTGGGAKSGKHKYTSKAFLDATKEPLQGGVTGEEVAQFDLIRLRASQGPTGSEQDGIKETVARCYTVPPQMFQSRFPFTEAQGGLSRLDTFSKQASISREGPPLIPHLDYMSARKLLEEMGWKSGTLTPPDTELTDLSQDSLCTSRSPMERRPMTPASSRHTSTATKGPPSLHGTQSRNRFGLPLISRLRSKSAKRRATAVGVILDNVNEAASQRPEPTVLQQSNPHTLPGPSGSTQLTLDSRKGLYPDDTQLRGRDYVFVVDSATSMAKHWIWATDLLCLLVACLWGYDQDGMELYFTCSKEPIGSYKLPADFKREMDTMRPPSTALYTSSELATWPPSTGTDMDASKPTNSDRESAGFPLAVDISDVLKSILDRWRTEGGYKNKLTIIVLTDGVWEGVNKSWVKDQIVHTLVTWLQKKVPLESRVVSVQFVRFGNDPEAIEVLDLLDKHLETKEGEKLPDIIDHEPADGGNIYKMIQGSLDPLYDGETTDAGTTEDVGSPVSKQGKGVMSATASVAPASEAQASDHALLVRKSNRSQDVAYSGGHFAEFETRPRHGGQSKTFNAASLSTSADRRAD